jgi:hypothetical protein
MSEYQRYEFMTGDRPLTRVQLDEVETLSSHIEASSTHALIEYDWGDFKHDPIVVLRRYFDGFLYWANWGAPQLALRFPHGILPANLLDGYDLDDVCAFVPHAGYDILDIHFGELEAPDEWVDYELVSLMPIRDELMDGDYRALYIVWLAQQRFLGNDEGDISASGPPVPPAFGALTGAQEALAELLQAPQELLSAAAHHSARSTPSAHEDVAYLVEQLPPERQADYLVRLARNEPGLSRKLLAELRSLHPDGANVTTPKGERVSSMILLAESQEIREQMEREQREREWQARQRRAQYIHTHQDEQWQRITLAVERGSGTGYDNATELLVDLREVTNEFGESRAFQERFTAWTQPHLKRPAFVKRLRAQHFPLPEP